MTINKRVPVELSQFLERYPPAVSELFFAIRGKVIEIAPGATEIVTNASYTVASGFTFTRSIKQAFIYVGAYKKHANLGFAFGASMEDPAGRLLGEGKTMRHVQIHELNDLTDPYIDCLIAQAADMAPRPIEPMEPIIHITKMKKDG
jgi:hypothetical protein